MKKILFLLLLNIAPFILFAQIDSVHMVFKGVPIDGTLKEYVQKMQKKGFSLVFTEDGIAILEGDFAGYKKCQIGVATLKEKDLVNKITVIFPQCNTWSSLSSDYFSLKDMLSEKYGELTICVETFKTEIRPKDDDSKLHEVGMDRCVYYTIYETKNGTIRLAISHDGFSSYFVTLTYSDKINSDIIKKKALEDL